MSRNKKILIGLGLVVVLGGIAYANIKFKRQDGVFVVVSTTGNFSLLKGVWSGCE